MLAVDTNILVYAHRREAVENAAAAHLLRELAEAPEAWAIPWPCVYEFFSVVTNPRIWRDAASTPAEAWAQLEAWFGSPSLHLLGEVDGFAAILRRFALASRVRGPIVHDARVAALCIAHGVAALLTRDRDFSLFPELATRNPLVP
ncbi:MAG: PIN domain-containing protein [Polyangiaceae bacterium]|nr:PIN domain-containing protein [Polyangiaceae bacterium]